MNDPVLRTTEERYCHTCRQVVTAEVTTYRAYALSECAECGHVVSASMH